MTRTRTLTDKEYETLRTYIAALPRDTSHATLIAEWQVAHDIGHSTDGGDARDRALYQVARRHRLLDWGKSR